MTKNTYIMPTPSTNSDKKTSKMTPCSDVRNALLRLSERLPEDRLEVGLQPVADLFLHHGQRRASRLLYLKKEDEANKIPRTKAR